LASSSVLSIELNFVRSSVLSIEKTAFIVTSCSSLVSNSTGYTYHYYLSLPGKMYPGNYYGTSKMVVSRIVWNVADIDVLAVTNSGVKKTKVSASPPLKRETQILVGGVPVLVETVAPQF
jgi:hypothetical protein